MNNELIEVALRTILVLIILFVLTKIMGKKQLSQMNFYDYLIGITIGSIASDISLDLEHNLISGIISLCIYAFSGVAVTYLCLKNLTLRKIILGTPTLLINKGNILIKNLRKEGIDINDLEEEARLNGFFELDKIDYAILETNGQISFLANIKSSYVTNENMNIKLKENSLDINLIQDGKILYENLEIIGKTSKWLDKKIKEKGYNNYKEIFLFKYRSDKETIIYDYQKNTANL